MTSIARTLLDIAADAPHKQLVRSVNQADREGRLSRKALHELLERNPRRKGTRALSAAIAALSPGTHRTRSDLEADFLELCRRNGIPMPVVNAKVEGYEVDMYWPRTKLIVELDSYEYHRTPSEFTHDRRRDAKLKLKNYEVLRVSDEWLNNDPDDVAETVERLLAQS